MYAIKPADLCSDRHFVVARVSARIGRIFLNVSLSRVVVGFDGSPRAANASDEFGFWTANSSIYSSNRPFFAEFLNEVGSIAKDKPGQMFGR